MNIGATEIQSFLDDFLGQTSKDNENHLKRHQKQIITCTYEWCGVGIHPILLHKTCIVLCSQMSGLEFSHSGQCIFWGVIHEGPQEQPRRNQVRGLWCLEPIVPVKQNSSWKQPWKGKRTSELLKRIVINYTPKTIIDALKSCLYFFFWNIYFKYTV